MTLKYYPTTKATALASAASTSDVNLLVSDGSTYPDPTVGDNGPYKVIVGLGSDREEVCIVTSKPTASTLRVTRAQSGTAATSKNVGDIVVHGVNSEEFTDAAEHIDATSGVHGVFGQLSVPIGGGVEWYAATLPAGWLLQDGSAISRTTYAALFAVIGTTWGAGDGTTTFNLPDRRGRVGVGHKAMDADHGTLGGTGGSKDSVAAHTHSINHDHPATTTGNDSPDHTHTTSWPGAGNVPAGEGYTAPIFNTTSPTGAATGGASTRHTHPVDIPAFTGTSGNAGTASGNLQPFVNVNYIIRAL